MVQKLISLLYREVRGMHEAAYVLGIFLLSSAILALVRDRLFAHLFGAGEILDIYYAAFRIPDILFVTIASMVSVYVLIPFLADSLQSNAKKARELLDSVFSIFLVVLVSLSAIVAVFAAELLTALFPGLSESARFEEFVLLTRILMLQPILLGVSNLCASITQLYQKFVLYAISPILYNLGIIFGALFFYPEFGMQGLAWGVVLGASLHLLIQVPFLIQSGFLPRLTFSPDLKKVWQVAMLSLPRTLTLSASQLVLVVMTAFASLLVSGSIAVFQFAYNLQSVPLALIGMSYSVAAFPTLARLFAKGEKQEFIRHISVAARAIIFFSLPIIALLIVLRAHVVRIILGSGEFDWADTRLTAAAFALFVLSLAAQGLSLLFIRGFYATGNTKRPLLVTICASLVAISSASLGMVLFQINEGWRLFFESLLRVDNVAGASIVMLPLGFTIGSIVQAALLYWFFAREYVSLRGEFEPALWKGALAGLAAGVVAYVTLQSIDLVLENTTFLGIFAHGFTAGVLGLIAAYGALKLVKSRELFEVEQAMHKKFWKTKTLVPDAIEKE